MSDPNNNDSKPKSDVPPVIDENLSDEDLDALLSADIKSSSRPPTNPFREGDQEPKEHTELLSALTESDESNSDEVVDYFGGEELPTSKGETLELESLETDSTGNDLELGEVKLGLEDAPKKAESVDFGFEYEAPEQDTHEFEVPEEIKPELEQQDSDKPADSLSNTAMLDSLDSEVGFTSEPPKFIDDSLSTDSNRQTSAQPDHDSDSPLAAQSDEPTSQKPTDAPTPDLPAASVKAPSVSTKKVSVQITPKSNSTASSTGNKIMSNQESQIEKILAGIDELKRKLHGMNSDFYNAATESATLISEVRELEVSSSAAQDFSATYAQSRDLRKNLVDSRKAFNVLASAIDELEEALESDLYAVQKNG